MEGWEHKPLGLICSIARGGSPRPIQEFLTDAADGVNWIKISDATASGRYIYRTAEKIKPAGVVRSRLVKDGDFLLSNSMSFGRPYIMRTSGCIHDGWLVLSDYQKTFDQTFLYYVLGSPQVFTQFDRLAAGSTVRNLNIDLASRVVVPVPPLPEQRRIVAILDEAFEAIATAKANTERNLQNVRGVLAGTLAALYPSNDQPVRLAELSISISDGDHSPPPKAASGVPFITISNIDKETREIDFSNTFMVPREYYEGLKPQRRPQPGDVLYTVTGSFGIPVLVEGDQEFCFQRHIGLIRPKPDVNSRWLTYALLSPAALAQADAGATGTAQRTVSLGTLRALKLPKVSSEAQCQDADRLDALDAEVGRLKRLARAKLAALDELKKSLLHQAFTGGLTAESTDKQLAEVA